MERWLCLRDKDPELYQQGVVVWGQGVGYEDSVICCWHSELLEEESKGKGAFLTVDLFAGELTEEVKSLKYQRNQIKHAIGSNQTARC